MSTTHGYCQFLRGLLPKIGQLQKDTLIGTIFGPYVVAEHIPTDGLVVQLIVDSYGRSSNRFIVYG